MLFLPLQSKLRQYTISPMLLFQIQPIHYLNIKILSHFLLLLYYHLLNIFSTISHHCRLYWFGFVKTLVLLNFLRNYDVLPVHLDFSDFILYHKLMSNTPLLKMGINCGWQGFILPIHFHFLYFTL